MPWITPYLLAATLTGAPVPAADWLERAWSDEVVGETGTPAITLNESSVLLVLPETALAEAHAAGVSTPDAVRLFVTRYGPHCAGSIDLDRPHQHLKVQLFLQKPAALEDASEDAQGEILDALKSAKTRPLPRVERVFAVSNEHADFFIDYVPERQAHCVRPGDDVS